MSCAHGCGGTGRLGSHLEVPCPCARETSDDALDRVIEEKLTLVRTVDELSKLVLELESKLATDNVELGKLLQERELLRAQVTTLRGHRLKLIDALCDEAAALQAARAYERAKALMALVREVADG